MFYAKKILLIFLLLATAIGCTKETEPDCTSVLPPPNSFEIDIVDTNGNSLIGNIYTQNTFRLYNSSFEKWIQPTPYGASNCLQVFFPDIENEVEYYIELDAMDSDTLQVNFSKTTGECFDRYTVNEMKYNGQNVAMVSSGGKFSLIKQQ